MAEERERERDTIQKISPVETVMRINEIYCILVYSADKKR